MIRKKQRLHTRKIDITTYEDTPDSVVVEGILKDDRLLESYRIAGERIPPGTFHHMVVRIKVRGFQLIIEEIEVEMPTVPHDICLETLRCLEPVKGMSITPGFTSKVKSLVGGSKGCNHLLALLTAMAPAAVQGAFSAKAREPLDQETGALIALKRLKDTCWVWRDKGPLIEKYKNIFQAAGSSERQCDSDAT
jgi:hypothetical protein